MVSEENQKDTESIKLEIQDSEIKAQKDSVEIKNSEQNKPHFVLEVQDSSNGAFTNFRR